MHKNYPKFINIIESSNSTENIEWNIIVQLNTKNFLLIYFIRFHQVHKTATIMKFITLVNNIRFWSLHNYEKYNKFSKLKQKLLGVSV